MPLSLLSRPCLVKADRQPYKYLRENSTKVIKHKLEIYQIKEWRCDWGTKKYTQNKNKKENYKILQS